MTSRELCPPGAVEGTFVQTVQGRSKSLDCGLPQVSRQVLNRYLDCVLDHHGRHRLLHAHHRRHPTPFDGREQPSQHTRRICRLAYLNSVTMPLACRSRGARTAPTLYGTPTKKQATTTTPHSRPAPRLLDLAAVASRPADDLDASKVCGLRKGGRAATNRGGDSGASPRHGAEHRPHDECRATARRRRG